MIPSVAAVVRVGLRRSRASWPIVAAAGLICLLASSLMAAGPMYASAVSLAGLHRVLADAPVTEANIGVSLRVDPAAWSAADAVVTRELDRAVGAAGGPVERYGTSESFDLPDGPSAPLTDIVTLGFADGIEAHADLLAGAWPVVTPDRDGVVPVAVADTVAERLSLTVGDELRLPVRATPDVIVPVRVVGTYHVRDPNDPFWWSDPQLIEGRTTSDRFATHGPLITTRAAFLVLASAAPGRVEVGWRAFPRADGFGISDIGPVAANVLALDDRLEAALRVRSVTVQTRLPAILADADRALLVGRTGVLLLTAQFVILAAYAVLLSAALLVEHRRTDTAMLRSRGAGPARMGLLALFEGLLLVVPAALLGPFVASIGLRALNIAGPLADIGLTIHPVLSSEAFVGSGLAALACLVALMIPALPRIRSFTAIHAGVGRAETRTAGQRFGLDLVLLTLAAVGLWQLRHYGAPLTRSVQGALGIDPLLVATPAIGFLAGAVLALRVVPLVALLIERATARRATLVPSLGARQLARRPLRYTRAALLLMLAVSMGVFAITYTRTWRDSQDDQATFQVGTDVRVIPGRRTVDPPTWSLDALYATVPGMAERMPVRVSSMRVPRSDASGALVGIDPAVAGQIVRTRTDLVDGTITDVVAPLGTDRPDVAGVPLPDGTRRLGLDIRIDVSKAAGSTVDPETGEERPAEVDPGRIVVPATARVVVRDARGSLARFFSGPPAVETGSHRVDIALGVPGRPDARLASPVELVAIEVSLAAPASYTILGGTFEVVRVQASSSVLPRAGDWTDLDLPLVHGWRTTASVQNLPRQDVGTVMAEDRLAVVVPDAHLPAIGTADEFGRGTLVTFAPADLTALRDAALPAVATADYLSATARSVGDELPIDVGGVQRQVRLVGKVEAFPTVTPTTPALIVDLPTLALHRFEATGAVEPPDAWWFAVQPGQADDVAARLRDPSFGSTSVVSLAERTRSLAADPVALGVIGALGIGIVAAAAFALIGFVVSASVSARERVGEFALLQALGLSARQLSGWLSLENATLALISLVAGTALGLLVAWVALPFVTVTRRAEPPFPPVVVSVPWSTIALVEVAGIVALSVTIVALTWSLARVALASTLRKGEE